MSPESMTVRMSVRTGQTAYLLECVGFGSAREKARDEAHFPRECRCFGNSLTSYHKSAPLSIGIAQDVREFGTVPHKRIRSRAEAVGFFSVGSPQRAVFDFTGMSMSSGAVIAAAP